MELRDFIVTPLVLLVVYILAYRLRPRFTDVNTRRFFIPALTVRIIGALAVGFIYQFYYGGGDTFGYHTHGSAIIWDAFVDSPISGLRLLFANENLMPDLFDYTSKIWFYGDLPSYFVIRIAAVFDLLTFRVYSATAVLFACMSFTGIWALYNFFCQNFPGLYKMLAIAVLFVPSVFFWGSGIFKDTITLTALGWATYSFDQFFFQKRKIAGNAIILLLTFFIIFSIKKYILLCFIPALIIWIYTSNLASIRSFVIKIMVAPFIFAVSGALAYWAIVKVGEDDKRYAIENIAQTAQITAYDIAYWTGRSAGSTYTLGELDGTYTSMFRLLPNAIIVSLFRPYFWEVSNPFMLLTAIESFMVLALTFLVIYETKIIRIFSKDTSPIVYFCLTFSLVFAFAVGVSTFNFGTLMRYKIPLLPYYISALLILYNYSKRERKLTLLDNTE
ncbi:MAG TPA: hypothetical protein PKL31_03345 [Fulvivirga sp.]|nr:hypothetical protein [Fulvivirga sp.]